MADGADAQGGRGTFNLRAEGGAFVAVLTAAEAQLHEFTGFEQFVQLGDECGCHSFPAEKCRIGHRLAESAQLGFLGTGEGRESHFFETTDEHG